MHTRIYIESHSASKEVRPQGFINFQSPIQLLLCSGGVRHRAKRLLGKGDVASKATALPSGKLRFKFKCFTTSGESITISK